MATELALQPPSSPPAKAPLPPLQMGQRGIQITTFDELQRFANVVVAAGLTPPGLETQPKVIIAIQAGAELGFTPMQALASIMVVNNRAAVYGDATSALVLQSGLLEEELESFEGEFPKDDFTAVCRIKRRGRAGYVEARFSVADAKAAGLWMPEKRTPWRTFPKRMLPWRARSWARRDSFADILRVMPTVEELRDLEPLDVAVEVKPPAAPTNGPPRSLDDLTFKGGLAAISLDVLSLPEAPPQSAAMSAPPQPEPSPPVAASGGASGFPGEAEGFSWQSGLLGRQPLSVPFLVNQGLWADWSGEEIPVGSPLRKNAKAKLWRDALEGSPKGGRKALLEHGVKLGLKAWTAGEEVSDYSEKCACCLALLPENAPAAAAKPEGAPSSSLFEEGEPLPEPSDSPH